MKTIFKAVIVLSGVLFVNDGWGQAPNWAWAKGIGGLTLDEGSGIAVDANGNTFVTGYFDSPSITIGSFTLPNAGDEDIFIAKCDPSGTVVWAKSVGSPHEDRGNSIAIDINGNCYVTGYFWNSSISFDSTTIYSAGVYDIFIVKYNSSGNVIWAKSAGGNDRDVATCISVDANGNAYLTGYFWSTTIAFGSINLTNVGANNNIFIAKYDASGNVIWAKSAGDHYDDECNGIAVDGYGNSYITGFFFSDSITFGNTTLFNSTSGSFAPPDIFIAKYDSSGNVIWAKGAGGNDDDEGSAVAVDGNGNVYITGFFYSSVMAFGGTSITNSGGGNNDLYIAKYDNSGNFIWAKSEGGSGFEGANSIAMDAMDNFYITGYFSSSPLSLTNFTLVNSGMIDVFIIKYDTSGNVLSAKETGGSGSEEPKCIAVDANGNSYITGYFYSSTLAFTGSTLSNSGMQDIFVAKLDAYTDIEHHNTYNSFTISPNPAFTTVTITSTHQHANTLTLYDITGRILLQQSFNGTTQIDVSKLARGMYIAEVRDKNGNSVNGKLLKE